MAGSDAPSIGFTRVRLPVAIAGIALGPALLRLVLRFTDADGSLMDH